MRAPYYPADTIECAFLIAHSTTTMTRVEIKTPQPSEVRRRVLQDKWSKRYTAKQLNISESGVRNILASNSDRRTRRLGDYKLGPHFKLT